jgi:hypothetical protein
LTGASAASLVLAVTSAEALVGKGGLVTQAVTIIAIAKIIIFFIIYLNLKRAAFIQYIVPLEARMPMLATCYKLCKKIKHEHIVGGLIDILSADV